MLVMTLCTLPRKFNWEEADIPKEERAAVDALLYYVENKVQLSGSPPL